MSSPKEQFGIVLGASGALGAAAARLMWDQGYSLLMAYNKNEHAIPSFINQSDVSSTAHNKLAAKKSCDITKPEAIQELFEHAARTFPTELAFVVLASGVNHSRRQLADIPNATIKEIVDVNLTGPLFFLRELRLQIEARTLQIAKDLSVVILSSEAGKYGGVNILPYASSKSGLLALIKGAAREFGPIGVRLNGVSPGLIRSRLHKEDDVEMEKMATGSVPLGRLGEADEVANLISWLISPQASYVNGEIVSVNGGR
jgi:NAD(P)-dependent dehydrogenase (short-subunit alcohol dehydrogenase family)